MSAWVKSKERSSCIPIVIVKFISVRLCLKEKSYPKLRCLRETFFEISFVIDAEANADVCHAYFSCLNQQDTSFCKTRCRNRTVFSDFLYTPVCNSTRLSPTHKVFQNATGLTNYKQRTAFLPCNKYRLWKNSIRHHVLANPAHTFPRVTCTQCARTIDRTTTTPAQKSHFFPVVP